MRTRLPRLGLLLYSLIFGAGCSESPKPPAKIDGLSPAEYREKAELSRALPVKKNKTGGAPR
jgi:hypothetical protein